MLKLKLLRPDEYEVSMYNDSYIGTFYKEVDGYFVWLPTLRGGFLPQEMLLAIGHKLEELNKDWHEQL